MIKEKLKNLFKVKPRMVELSMSDLGLYSKDVFDDAQIGYRIDEEGKKIEDWIGEEYYVIGDDSMCGDPIIVKSDEPELPIYFMFHDDWDSLEKIANSVEDFAKILKMISEVDWTQENEVNELKDKINAMTPENSYWESLIRVEYENINEE